MKTRTERGFTLVELIVVVGIVALLISVLMPALSRARAAAVRTKCLANLRQLSQAQMLYAVDQKNALVFAGDGTEQGSWIGLLQPYSQIPLVRRCPSDASTAFDVPYVSGTPPVSKLRLTSYGINNFGSPTHGPSGMVKPTKITQIPKSARIVQFVELAESGSYSAADHVHAHQWFNADEPTMLNNIQLQMAVGRHGGLRSSWTGVLNYAFFDGHAESLPLREVYVSDTNNAFDIRLYR